MIWIGSRANFGRLKCVIEELIKEKIEIGIVLGSYDIPAFKEYVIGKIDNYMYNDTEFNMAISSSIVTINTINIINSRLPKLAIVHGDRFENLGFAIACAYSNVPLLHTEGGEVSGNIDNKIRNAITSLADYHCTPTVKAEMNLKLKKIENVKFTGSPAIDYVKSLKLVKDGEGEYTIVLFNPCPGEDLRELISALYKVEGTIYWINANLDPGHRTISKLVHKENLAFLKNLTPLEYYVLLSGAKRLIGNTSSGIKEGAFLEIPYILVGDRQRGREVANNVYRCKCKKEDIELALEKSKTANPKYDGRFGEGNASWYIVRMVKEIYK